MSSALNPVDCAIIDFLNTIPARVEAAPILTNQSWQAFYRTPNL
jgi:hypothetical protein